MTEKRSYEPLIVFSHWEEQQAQNAVRGVTGRAIAELTNNPAQISEQAHLTKTGLAILLGQEPTSHMVAANIVLKNISTPMEELAGNSYLRRNDLRFRLYLSAAQGIDTLLQSVLTAEQADRGIIDKETVRSYKLTQLVNLYKDDPSGRLLIDAIVKNQEAQIEKQYDRDTYLTAKGKLFGYQAAQEYYPSIYEFLTQK